MFARYREPREVVRARWRRRALWFIALGGLFTAFQYFGTAEGTFFFGLVRGLYLGIAAVSVGAGLLAVSFRLR